MPHASNITCFFILLFLFVSCDNNQVQLSGDIDYMGEAHIILQEQPIHYKYAPVLRDTFSVSEEGSFSFVTTGTEQIKTLIINDESYPLILSPDKNLDINISRSDFPQEVNVEGYSESWDENYNDYLNEISSIETQIPIEEEKIKIGEENSLLELSKNKYQIAENTLNGTPLRDYYLKAIGEYLVFKVRAIEYNQRFFEDFDAEAARKEVFAEADSLNFFTIESLKAQRAGIRDFAHYFARTFEIYDSVKTAYGQEDLAEYDIKRLAYEELNEKRLQVLDHIKTRDALAHARMYLVAERIGEQPLEVAKPSYEAYLAEFSDYPEYTEFLTYFYNEIKSVSPGQPAIPFSLPDLDGDIHTMEDYRGKFVLLDFWAGWCQPCLEEFSYMKDIYAQYSRDELEIIGISNEVDSLVWVQDLERFELPWVQLYSGKGFNEETFKAYKGGGIPFYILVDPEGKIARYNDIRPSFNFNSVLDSLLSQHKNQLN